MEVLTKELKHDLELHEIRCAVDSRAKRTLPMVFLNGDCDGVADSAIKTIKTNFNVTDKENELKFMILPATFTFFDKSFEHGRFSWKHTPENDFAAEYANRLRIISYLPEEILKQVKDKRLLAFGYAEPKVKKAIISYARTATAISIKMLEGSLKESLDVASELTIEEEFEKHDIYSIEELFSESTITGVRKIGNELYIGLNKEDTFVLTDVETLEEEVDPENTYIEFFELHKAEQGYELHFLLMTTDNNFVENFHYVTYRFRDMMFKK